MTLSTPLLWVILPLIIAAITGVFSNRRILSIALASTGAFGLALLAAFFPEDLILTIGPLSFTFVESLAILGRRITLTYEILPFIRFTFGMTGLWILGSNKAGAPSIFQPICLVITALLTAAVGVEPFLYAALLILTAILVSIPILSPADKRFHTGILRYLTLQTIALPFILLAGWLLTGVETLPPESRLVIQTTLVLGLGFALLLGVFPFHSWVPRISQNSHPMVVSYLLFILPTTVFLFGLYFFNRYAFLRTSQEVYETVGAIGTLMILLGGGWTAVQNNLKRAFGFVVMMETGFSLLAFSLSGQGGLVWMMLLFPARGLAFWLWGFALSLMDQYVDNLDMEHVQGIARRYPVLAAGLLLAQLSIAGLPLLASFPVKISLLTTTFSLRTGLGLWAFIGNLGLFAFTIRLLASMVSESDKTSSNQWIILEKRGELLPIILLVLGLLMLGLFPHTLPTGIINTLTAFTQLQ